MADRQVDRRLRRGRRGLTGFPDVAIVGGGIVGCAAAAFLAEGGARVELFERAELAAAASGRNSGSIQHPFDPVLAELHVETLRHYRELGGFELPERPAGVLMLGRGRAALEAAAADIERDWPELEPTLLGGRVLHDLEPGLGPRLWACRLETGYPVRPAAATLAFAKRARRAGALLHEGRPAWPWVRGGRTRGLIVGHEHCAAGSILVAAGPWTPEVIDPTRVWRPIVPVWGLVLEVELADPPRHVLEEAGVKEVAAGGPGSLFSLVASDGAVSVGSTFLDEEPDTEEWVGVVREAGERFVPGLARAAVVRTRTCARPQSFDGRPLVGPVGDVEGIWIAAGHGPWGISAGPATARLAADALLGRAEVPAALVAARGYGGQRV
jgi:glycine/D-amino acid oxidase-like deaminating enzyme